MKLSLRTAHNEFSEAFSTPNQSQIRHPRQRRASSHAVWDRAAGASWVQRMPGLALVALTALGAAACGGSYPGSAGANTTPTAASAAQAGQEAESGIEVAAAALPYQILRAKQGGQEVPEEDFYRELAAADAICIGETHKNPHHHWAQLHLLDRLSDPARAGDIAMSLGMEMFQRPFQGVLDDYAAGDIDEEAMLSRTGWETRWGYDYGLYRPIIRLAVERGARLMALNVADELRKRVSRQGLDAVTDSDRARLPELKLDDAEHRAWWDAVMAAIGGHGHGGHPGSNPHGGHGDGDTSAADRIYTIQVLWDETMADTASRWLAEGEGRQMIILAGSGHCHDSAIVRRMLRRGVESVVSVRPMLDAPDVGEDVSSELAEPITDYLFVMSP